MRLFCFALAFAVLGVVSAFAITPTEYSNLTYSTVSQQTLDLFEPSPLGSVGLGGPAIVFVHGGGWSAGEKEDMDAAAYYYAAQGYVTISINYRLTTVAPWPACINDCQAAVRWLRKYASFLRVDSNHIAAYGVSAGGHLVSCMGTNDTLHDFDPSLSGYSSRVQAVVDYLGPSDLTDPSIWEPSIWYLIEALVGHSWHLNPQDFRKDSPAYMVTPTAAPAIIFGSESDPIVPIAQSREMYQVYQTYGVPSEYHAFPGAGHGFTDSEYLQCLAYEGAFLKKWLRGQ